MCPRLAVVLAGVALAATGCGSAPPAGQRHAAFTFSCCAARDLDRVYHPGEVVTLHWTAHRQSPQSQPTTAPLWLHASLSGAFGSPRSAKSGDSGPDAVVRAKAVRASELRPSRPVSRLRIPRDATPGFYNLTTSIETGDMIDSTTATIRVE